jgi:hypothetical protein
MYIHLIPQKVNQLKKDSDFASSTPYEINIESFLAWIFNLMDAYGYKSKNQSDDDIIT